MAATVEYNVRAELKAYLAGNDFSDPREAAEAFIDEIPEEEYANCLLYLLPDLVRNVWHSERPRPVPTDSGSTKKDTPRKASPSKWDKTLRARYTVRDGVTLMLGDCTSADLEALVNSYRKRAAENSSVADRLDNLRNTLRSKRLRQVKQLPSDLVTEIMES